VNSFTLSPIISERERAENLCGERKKKICVSSKKKEKKAESREKRVKKQKKWNNELSSCIGNKVSSSCLKCACHKIANGEEEKNFLHFYSS
jgi:hypothetical protein